MGHFIFWVCVGAGLVLLGTMRGKALLLFVVLAYFGLVILASGVSGCANLNAC